MVSEVKLINSKTKELDTYYSSVEKPRCLMASYIRIPAATDTLSD